MRDIRSDLQDRAGALERELKAAQTRFDELMVRLKEEHEDRLEDLKNELDAVKLIIGLERRRLADGVANGHTLVKPQPQAQQSEAPRLQAQPSPPPVPAARTANVEGRLADWRMEPSRKGAAGLQP